MILLGELSLWVAFLMAAWSTIVSYAGGALRREDLTESGARAVYAAFVMMALAAIGLWTGLLSRDFSLEYVAGHISQLTPRVYVFTAFWSGLAGSLLLSALLLSGFAAMAVATNRLRNRALMPWATGTLSAILLFVVAMTCFAANPFHRMDVIPLDGSGMNPRLQYPAMALYRPSLYLGYAATVVPFALVVAALLSRRVDGDWLGVVRRWTVLAWFFLTIGIVLGVRSAYIEPESTRGGDWAWDAVRNPSILPWLTITASLHSIAAQGKRGSMRKSNVVLIALSFLLSMLAAFITRGGGIESEPAFAQSPIGTWLSAVFFLTAGITIYLIGTRVRDLAASEPAGGVTDRRYGGHIAHAGAVMLLIAAAGLPWAREYEAKLKTGESYQATDPFGHVWRFVSQGVSQFDRADHVVAILALDTYRDSKRVGLITSERRTYRDMQGNQLFDPSLKVGIHSTGKLDTYVVPGNLRRTQGSDIADLRVAFNPLVAWLWMGGVAMALGGLIVVWPRAERRRAPAGYVAS